MTTIHHDCGGTILIARCQATYESYYYCDRCGAYRWGDEPVLPSGTDAQANGEAWDAGDLESPDEVPELTAEQFADARRRRHMEDVS